MPNRLGSQAPNLDEDSLNLTQLCSVGRGDQRGAVSVLFTNACNIGDKLAEDINGTVAMAVSKTRMWSKCL